MKNRIRITLFGAAMFAAGGISGVILCVHRMHIETRTWFHEPGPKLTAVGFDGKSDLSPGYVVGDWAVIGSTSEGPWAINLGGIERLTCTQITLETTHNEYTSDSIVLSDGCGDFSKRWKKTEAK